MKARILTLDIETSPHDAWSFNVWKTNILPMHIKEPTKMLTWAAKFHGEKKIYYRSFRDDDFLEGRSARGFGIGIDDERLEALLHEDRKVSTGGRFGEI